MVINGVKLEFDIYDADQMEAFEDALERATEEIEASKLQNKQSQVIRRMCEVTINMLDEVFGEGAANDIFEGETNFKKCLEVFKGIILERAKQEDEMAQEIEELRTVITREKEQQPNRAARRATRKS